MQTIILWQLQKLIKNESEENQSCFDAQVGALLSMDELVKLPIEAVHVDEASLDNIILDTCRENEAVMDFAENVFRGIPCLSQVCGTVIDCIIINCKNFMILKEKSTVIKENWENL